MTQVVKAALAASIIISSSAALAASYKCPIDNLAKYFTGNTQTTYGRLLKEYRCSNGHTSWGR